MAEVVTKKGRSRKPLKDISANDVNISAGNPSSTAPFPKGEKENREGLTLNSSPKKKTKKVASKPKASSPADEISLEDELREMEEKFEKLQIEKKKTEELLREREEMLKQKDEEIEKRGKEQEKLQKELKKLQKLKEFKPTVSLPVIKSLREKEEENKDKKKKKKKNKDLVEKKKPCAAYISWCRDQWNEVKKERPEADFKEVSNLLGARWKSLSAEEKKPYEEKYQKEKEEYLKIVGQEKRENEAMKLLEEEQVQKTAMELLEQYLQFKQDAEKEVKKSRKEKDPLKPKQPMSAFFLYSNDRRASLIEEKKNVLEIAKIAGEEWKNMTEDEKAPYEEKAKQQKEEYARQMELYKQRKLEETVCLEKEEEEQKKILKQEALQLLKKKEKTENIIKKTKETKQKQKKKREEKNTDPNKPKKPASSFLLFSKEARKSLLEEKPGISNSTLSAMISVKWKELSEADRKVWNEKAAEGMEAYKREMEEYNKSVANGNNVVPNS
ncbi:high mobility group B protein 13 [Dioscorea cayenensis subsp. rotundata]|uniref:High mobility group B protein 13 n=1 Tax=Dioscorea cayennensis subsp. rotundata TaxID=55577 RepID=A0AB40BA44_DIOCR|nr:high mobility group B protein 13 [Dioscorea cayenensis subsp. rotundata]